MKKDEKTDSISIDLHFDDSIANKVLERFRKGELTTFEEIIDALPEEEHKKKFISESLILVLNKINVNQPLP